MKTTPKSEFKVGDRISVHNVITKKESFKATIVGLGGTGDNIVGLILKDGNERPQSNTLGSSLKIENTNKVTHTQGRWEVGGSPVAPSVTSDGLKIDSKIAPFIYGNTLDEAKANAKLIASAPEMLEILKEISPVLNVTQRNAIQDKKAFNILTRLNKLIIQATN